MDMETMRQQLVERVRENYADYRADLLLKDRQELIDGADRISKTAEVFQYFTEHRLTEPETAYFLQFQNPLEVAADHWSDCEFELDALGALIADVVDRADDLTLYPLAADAPTERPSSLQKFMNVDLETAFPQIMAQKTAFYQKDLTYALDELREGAATNDPAKRNFVVIFRQSGVECLNERDMFIAGTRSYNTCQYYHKQTSEPVLAYSVELLGDGANGLRGNLYQQDQHQMAQFAERASSPYTDVTITFFDGKQVRIPEKEYNYETIPSLKFHYGDIRETRHEADDESVVQGAIKREHERRERMPRGHVAVHVQKLEESRIQTEADRLASALQNLTEPNTPDKTHFMAEVSPYFVPLASDDDMYRLFAKVQEQVKQPIYIAPAQTVGNREGQFFFMRREERTQEQAKKPSIKEAELDVFNADTDRADQFLEMVKRYTDFSVLTTPMIMEFVDKIVVHAPDKSSGERTQEVDIYLKFIGKFDVPIPEPTPEELAEQERRQKLRERQREYTRRSREKKKLMNVQGQN